MKAITLRNLPEIVADAVSTKAKDEHLSISKAIVALLAEHVSESKGRSLKKRDLGWLASSMTPEDAEVFDAVLKDQRKIDPEMWK